MKIDKRTKEYKQAKQLEAADPMDSATIAPPVVSEDAKPVEAAQAKVCPWCVSLGKNGDRLLLDSKWVCLDCGKLWKSEALGRPYTLALEQGIV